MRGTVNVKTSANYGDGSNHMTAKSRESVECKDRENSESAVRECSDFCAVQSVTKETPVRQ